MARPIPFLAARALRVMKDFDESGTIPAGTNLETLAGWVEALEDSGQFDERSWLAPVSQRMIRRFTDVENSNSEAARDELADIVRDLKTSAARYRLPGLYDRVSRSGFPSIISNLDSDQAIDDERHEQAMEFVSRNSRGILRDISADVSSVSEFVDRWSSVTAPPLTALRVADAWLRIFSSWMVDLSRFVSPAGHRFVAGE